MKLSIEYIWLLLPVIFAFRSDDSWVTITLGDVDSEVKKMEVFYKMNTFYSVTVSHSSYIGHNSNTPFEKMDGYLIKNNNLLHSKMLGIETIQNEKYKIVIDTAEATISVSDPDMDMSSQTLPLGAELARKNIVAAKRMNHQKGERTIRIEFSKSVALTSEEIKLGQDSRLKELVMYYRASYNVDQDDKNSVKEQPKVKISLGEYKLKPKLSSNEFATTEYFAESKEGKLIAGNKYKKFQVLDLRVSKHIK